ncbi:arylsulfotransferase family protein [Candidatus Altiarchaeota archaeon]
MNSNRKIFIVFSSIFVVTILTTTIVLYIAFSFNEDVEKSRQGRWRRAILTEEEQQSRLSQLISLGYLSGYNHAPEKIGVTVYDKELAFDGLNMFTSGHAAEAFIMDMEGNIIHNWRYNIESVWEGYPMIPENRYWRRIFLFDNGDILAIFEGIGIIKLDKNSNLIWEHKGEEHHDISVSDDGRIYVLSRKERIIPWINKTSPVLDDYITILDSSGNVFEEYSILECLKNSSYAFLLEKMKREGDILHTNALEVLDGRSSDISALYEKGNVIISIRDLDVIAIIDMEENKVVWALDGSNDGLWKKQHDPVLLSNGNILVFDNYAGINRSRVIEYNPFNQEIAWEYKGDTVNSFFSKGCGVSQRLPNGNTLITETDNGRAFEVTPDNKIVWEYVNPHRAGLKNELIATLLHMNRLNHSSIEGIL